MVEVEYDGKVLFSDVSGHWAESYINEAATAEWIVGYNGLFRPDDNITRAEVMTLVNRVLNREPESKDDLLDGMTGHCFLVLLLVLQLPQQLLRRIML